MSLRLTRHSLMLGNLVIGLAVLGPAGMIVQIADDFGVSVREAGLLVTYGAIVLAFGSPAVAWATSRVDRRTLLTWTLALMAVFHAASALAPNYGTLLTLRIALLIAGAVFTPQAASTIARLAEERERPAAIAHVFIGWPLATTLGLPVIAWVAGHYGWRMAFGMLAALNALVVVLTMVGLPRGIAGLPLSLSSWLMVARNRLILKLIAGTAFATAGQFGVLVYTQPITQALVKADVETISALFLMMGLTSLAGNLVLQLVVGRIGPFRASAIYVSIMVVGLTVWTLGAHALPTLALGMGIVGIGFAATNSMQQARLAAAAPALSGASIALNTSAIYVGQAIASAIGGFLVEKELFLVLGLYSIAMMVCALTAILLTRPRT